MACQRVRQEGRRKTASIQSWGRHLPAFALHMASLLTATVGLPSLRSIRHLPHLHACLDRRRKKNQHGRSQGWLGGPEEGGSPLLSPELARQVPRSLDLPCLVSCITYMLHARLLPAFTHLPWRLHLTTGYLEGMTQRWDIAFRRDYRGASWTRYTHLAPPVYLWLTLPLT